MKSIRIQSLLLIFALFSVFGCTDLQRISFPAIQTLGWETGENDKTEAILSLEITGLENNQLVDQAGHILGFDGEEPTLEQNERILTLGSQGTGVHENQVTNLSPGQTYSYRAFALYRGNTYYGETLTFNTIDIPIEISAEITEKTLLSPTSLQLTIQTDVSGLEQDLVLNNYGFVWSENPGPSLENSETLVINPSIPAPDEVFNFNSQLTGLEPGAYVGRSFVTIGDKTYYGEDLTFTVGNIWIQRTSPENASGRLNPLYFAIDSKGYVGGGADLDFAVLGDFWEYDPATDSWTQKADLGGGPRYAGNGFAIAGKGYIAMGIEADYGDHLTTFMYDPATNTWIERQEIPLSFNGTTFAFSFAVNGKGYVGAGENFVCPRCVLEYDPVADSWTQVADFPEDNQGLVGLSIGNKGYAGTGLDENGETTNIFYEYDPAADSWTPRANVPGPPRSDAFAFAIDGVGYMGGGNFSDVWAYHPADDEWVQVTDFAGPPRFGGFGFAIDGRGYAGMGLGDVFYQDIWEYFPE